ncbi:MAG: DUF2752 domain-containing protein [Myxococcales bacterium]|nr:DUF2752 domain-containing protein [Myxococcales bacterium]
MVEEGKGPAEAGGWAARVLLSPLCRGVALVILVASFLLPPRGLGFTICWFNRWTGWPCPGCGLTRSVTHVSHGDLLGAVDYHPFGLLVWMLAVALCLLQLGGPRLRAAVQARLAPHERGLRRSYMFLVYAFIAFGVVRMAAAILDDTNLMTHAI